LPSDHYKASGNYPASTVTPPLLKTGQVPTPTHPTPPYIWGVFAKTPTWGFAQADIKQCTTQNQTAIIFPKEEFMAAYYSASNKFRILIFVLGKYKTA
jgi:hypothetical protein